MALRVLVGFGVLGALVGCKGLKGFISFTKQIQLLQGFQVLIGFRGLRALNRV